jgi:hypothetical protein
MDFRLRREMKPGEKVKLTMTQALINLILANHVDWEKFFKNENIVYYRI